MKIERCDLEIPLSPSQVEPVEKWVRAFTENQLTMVANPTVENGTLRIAPFDFASLLGYIDRAHSNEFDIHRLKALGISEIRRLLARKRANGVRNYYADCIRLIESVRIGANLEQRI